jgi:voltage-gated potassium channel
MVSLRKIIGLAGVAKNEHYVAQQWGRRFEFFMVLIAIWLPLQWHMQKHNQILPELAQIANWFVWLFFVAETLTLSFLVQNHWHYLKRNWLNIVIICLGVPWIWQLTPLVGIVRGLQLLLMLRLLLPWWNTSVHFLSRNRLGTTLTTAFVTTTLAGVLMAAIDPQFKSPWTGIWWAWETVTTVGYGDNVPTSFAGRLLAVIVMLMGIALISLLTANFSAYFISKGVSQTAHTEDQILKTLQDIHKRLDKIDDTLKK